MRGVKALLCLRNENNKHIRILITSTGIKKVTMYLIKIIKNKTGNRKKLKLFVFLCGDTME